MSNNYLLYNSGYETIYPNYNFFWNGQMSVLSTRSALMEYILSLLKNSNKKVSFILSSCDGLQSVHEYHENINKLDHTSVTIVGALCTRHIQYPNVLYIPLDEETFSKGLSSMLNKIPSTPWELKTSKVFWRGGASGYVYPSPRTKVTELLCDYKNADVKLTKWGGWEKSFPIPDKYFGDRCSLDKHFTFKYILIIDGNGIASNHQWVFGSGSVPIMVTHPENNWWFKKYLKPMVNYVPIDYYNLNELTEKIEWLVANDEEAKKIMMNAMALSQTLFSHEGHCEYLKEEIQQLLS